MVDRDDRHVLGEDPLDLGVDPGGVLRRFRLPHQRVDLRAGIAAVIGAVGRGEQVEESRGLVVVAAPGRAGHVEFPVLADVEIGLPLEIRERRAHAQLLFPHLADHGGDLLVALGGVVDQLEGEVADARFLDEPLRLGVALALAQLRIGDVGHPEPGGLEMGEVVGRPLPALEKLLHDDVAVDRHAERPAHPHVAERGVAAAGMVDRVVIGAEARDAPGLVGQLLLQSRVLPGRQRLQVVELAGAVAGERLVDVVDDETGDLFQDRLVGIPVHRVLHPRMEFVEHHFLEHIGAVRDDVTGRRPLCAVRLDRRPVRGKQGGVGGHRREIGQRPVEPDLQRMVVDRLYPQGGGRLPAGQDLLCVRYLGELEIPPVGRGGPGVGRAPPSIDEVVRGHRIAVRPPGVLAQREGVGPVAVGCLIRRGDAGHQPAVGILAQQPLEQVADHMEPRNILVQLRIERRKLVEQAVGEGLVAGQRLAGRRVGPGDLGLGASGQRDRRRGRLQGGGKCRSWLVDRHGSLFRGPALPAGG